MGLYSNLKFFKKILTTNFGFFDPYELNFAITYKCNSRCIVCNIWKKIPENELSLNEIKKIAEKIDFIHWVRLTGGEPFLRTGFVDLVKAFSKLSHLYFLSIPTNGLLPDLIYKKVTKILKFFKKKFTITVSLDGPEKIHDKIRGVKGSWERALETYIKLKSLEKKNNKFRVYFGYTLSPFNVGYFKKTFDNTKEKIPEVKITDFHVNLYQISDFYYSNADRKIPKKYFKAAAKELDMIVNLRKNSGLIEKIFDPIFKIQNRYVELGIRYLKTKKIPIFCNIFNLSCFIDPPGNVYPCSIFNRNLGNLREFNYDLKKILKSKAAQYAREEIKKGRCPQCWTPCEAHQLIFSNWFEA